MKVLLKIVLIVMLSIVINTIIDAVLSTVMIIIGVPFVAILGGLTVLNIATTVWMAISVYKRNKGYAST